MLVLQPSTSTEMEGPLGRLVSVSVGVFEIAGINVFVGAVVAVEMLGVADAIMTDVAVKIGGVDVAGRNGVGGLPGTG